MKKKFSRIFGVFPLKKESFNRADFVVILFIISILAIFVEFGKAPPEVIKGPEIKLSPKYLPFYAGLSTLRMLAAYFLSIIFTFIYGTVAAKNKNWEKILIPVLDILQSVPLLSFLPITLLFFTKFLPTRMAVELSSIFLLFTCQGWNITFSWYQSLITVPEEYREISKIFRFNWWLRFRKIELPFATVNIVWNSMLSWAGGWFFLMAAEMLSVEGRDFRLPGIGAYLQQASSTGDIKNIVYGVLFLFGIILILDQIVWRPLLCWAERFRTGENEEEMRNWFYDILRKSHISSFINKKIFNPVIEKIDMFFSRRGNVFYEEEKEKSNISFSKIFLFLIVISIVSGGVFIAGRVIKNINFRTWINLLYAGSLTFLRVMGASLIALLWTVPVGVAIGMNKKLAKSFQPVVQIFASIPATAFFPVIFFYFLRHNFSNLNLSAIIIMLLGSQWYLLFNVIAGASSIPETLKTTSSLLFLSKKEKWKVLILPAIFPNVVTGLITATGGSWNVSIIAEYVHFSAQTYKVKGLGSMIVEATAKGDYNLLFAATLSMIIIVVLINRFVWRKLYDFAEQRYRMEF